MLRLSGYYLGFLFRHYHSQISFQKPAVSSEFRAFAGFLQANGRAAFHVSLNVCSLFSNSFILFSVYPYTSKVPRKWNLSKKLCKYLLKIQMSNT